MMMIIILHVAGQRHRDLQPAACHTADTELIQDSVQGSFYFA